MGFENSTGKGILQKPIYILWWCSQSAS